MAESWGWDQPEESAGHRSNTSAPAAGCTTFLKHIVLCVWPTSCDLIKWIRWILQMFTFLALDTRGSERFGSHADVFTAHELPETWRRSLCLFRRTLACVCDVTFWRSAIIAQWYISLCTLRDFNCLKCSAARMQVCSLTLGRVNPRLCWNVTFIYAATLHLEHLLWSPQNTDANCPEVSLKSVLWRHQTKCWNTTLWPESQVINSPDSHIRSGKKKKKERTAQVPLFCTICGPDEDVWSNLATWYIWHVNLRHQQRWTLTSNISSRQPPGLCLPLW